MQGERPDFADLSFLPSPILMGQKKRKPSKSLQKMPDDKTRVPINLPPLLDREQNGFPEEKLHLSQSVRAGALDFRGFEVLLRSKT